MQGSEYISIQLKEEYEEVSAYSVSTYAEGGSGDQGYYEQGATIYWTTETEPGGITNNGWYTDDPNSPFYNVSEEEILNHIATYQNLNTYFTAWGNSDKNRDTFVRQTIPESCWVLS